MNELLIAILLSILLTGIAYGMAEFFMKIFKINHPKNSFFVYLLVFLITFSFIPITMVGLSNTEDWNTYDSTTSMIIDDGNLSLENITKSPISSKITPLNEHRDQQINSTQISSRFLLEISWYDFIVEDPIQSSEEPQVNSLDEQNEKNDRVEEKSLLSLGSIQLSQLPPLILFLGSLSLISCIFVLYQLFCAKKRYLRKINASPSDQKKLNRLVKRLADELQIHNPQTYVYHGSPNAFVLGHPAILVVSDTLVELLSENELKTTLRHELTHIKQHDILLKAFVQAGRILCFFNPFAHLLASKLFNKRELLADSTYNHDHNDKISFMEALVKIADYTRCLSEADNWKTPAVSVSLLQLTSYHPSLTDRFISLFRQCQKKTILTLMVSIIILLAQGSALIFTQSYLSPTEETIVSSDSALVNVEKQYIVEDVTYTTVYQNNQQYQGKMVHKTLYNIVELPAFEHHGNLKEIISYILLQYYQSQQTVTAF